MARPTRAATHADFFTPRCHQPQPRRPRGNERIREAAAKHSCASQCSDWLCILNESFWLSSAFLSFFSWGSCADKWVRTQPRIDDEGVHAHSEGASETTSSLVVDPSAHLADLRKTLDSSPEAKASFDRLEFLTVSPAANVDVEETLAALDKIENTPYVHDLRQSKALSLLDRLLTEAEEGYTNVDISTLHEQGHRIQHYINIFASDINPLSKRNIRYSCLEARCHALVGDLQSATAALHKIEKMPLIYEERGIILRVYNNILRSTRRHYDDIRVLDFVLAEWMNIGVYQLGEHQPPTDSVADRQDWDEERRLRLGQLLIEALCSRTLAVDAHSVFQEMSRQGLDVEHRLRLSLVRSLAEKASLATGLYLYAHQGDVVQAERYFERLSKEDRWVGEPETAMLIYSYATNGRTEDAIAVFEQLFPDREEGEFGSPKAIHYSIIIYAFAQKGDFSAMNEWLEIMASAGFPPDIYVYSIILRGFALRGDVDSIIAVLDQMRAANILPTVVTYTTAITLLARRRDPIAVESVYKRAIQEGIIPDRKMINTGVRLSQLIPMRHARLAIETYNTLLKAYILIGAPFRVVSKLFSRLESTGIRPDNITFTLLVQSACDSGLMDVASEIVEEMDRLSTQPNSDIKVDVYVLTIVMAGFLRLGNKIRAKETYEEMQTRGIQPTSLTFGAILKAYGRENSDESLQIAEEFVNSLMSSESPRTWDAPAHGGKSALSQIYGPLIASFARKQRPKDVERVFQGYLDAGGAPTIGILSTLLNCYRCVFNVEAAKQDAHAFRKYEGRCSFEPVAGKYPLYPLSIYIDVLSAAGLHTEIAEVWGKFQVHGFAFDSHNWNHLTVALIRAGEPERAFEVLERIAKRVARYALSFDKLPAREDLLSEPSEDPPMHSAERRAKAANTVFKQIRQASEEETDLFEGDSGDFAHPLRILHQISPSWNIWAPHNATLSVLLMVLTRLQEGTLMDPCNPKASRWLARTPKIMREVR
ncbi:Protein Rf [Salix suchowensis]|nr:Protein Rf [Salix suchowensis]